MLTDPRDALAEQSSLINGLVGLAGLAQMVHALAADPRRRVTPAGQAGDFVHLLLAVASLGEAVARLIGPAPAHEPHGPPGPPPPSTSTGWLR